MNKLTKKLVMNKTKQKKILQIYTICRENKNKPN